MSDDGWDTFRKPTWFNQFTTLRESRFVPPVPEFQPKTPHRLLLRFVMMGGSFCSQPHARYRPDGSRDGAAWPETIDLDPAAHANARPVIRMLGSFSSMTPCQSTREPRTAER